MKYKTRLPTVDSKKIYLLIYLTEQFLVKFIRFIEFK